jgi:hypothetical protein
VKSKSRFIATNSGWQSWDTRPACYRKRPGRFQSRMRKLLTTRLRLLTIRSWRLRGSAVADVDVARAGRFSPRRWTAESGGEVAHYLVVHAPSQDNVVAVRPPTRLRELAETSTQDNGSPRWLKTWSPDLNDDRIFTLWDAESADEVRAALAEFGFLDDMDATPGSRVGSGRCPGGARVENSAPPFGAPTTADVRIRTAVRGVAQIATSLNQGQKQCLRLVPSASACDGSIAPRS